MNGFLQAVLSTVSNAGLQGMAGTFFNASGLRLQASGIHESSQTRGPPLGLSGLFGRIRTSFGSVVQTLKNTAGKIKSVFVSARGGSAALFGGRDSSSGLPSAYDEYIQEYSQIDFDSEDNPYYKPLDLGAQIQYGRSSARDGVSFFDMDEGTRQILRLDPNTKNVLSNERVGLPARGSVAGNLKPSFVDQFNEARYGAADYLTAGLHGFTGPIVERLGGPFANPFGLSLTIGRGMAEGYIDVLRFGSEFGTIRDSLSAAFRGGEFQKAIYNFASGRSIFSGETPNLFRAGQGIVTEGLRGTAIFGTAMGSLRGVGNIARVLKGTQAQYLDLAHGGSLGKFRSLYEEGFIPRRFDPDARFGRGLYLAQDSDTVLKELAYHGKRSDLIASFRLNLSKAKVLDLTDPAVKRAYRFDRRFSKTYAPHQAIAQRAKAEGYNVIKYESFRNRGRYNYAVLDDFDELLKGRYPFR